MKGQTRAPDHVSDDSRFDRSSWVTLGIALTIFALTLGVVAAAYNVPTDGWDTDIGAWGRYSASILLAPLTSTPANGNLQNGDVLLAVEGRPFEQLEAQAAALRPQRPPNWQLGQTVRYTVLRAGQKVDLDVTLVHASLFRLYNPIVLLESPILLSFPIFLLIGAVVFALRPRERAAQLLFLFGFAAFNDNFITWSAMPVGVANLFSIATYWPKIILGNMLWAYLITPVLVHLFIIFPARKGLRRRFPYLVPLIYGICAAESLAYVALNVSGHYVSGVSFISLANGPFLLLIVGVLIHSTLTVAEPVARMQVRWITFGSLVGLVGPVGMWIAVGGMSPTMPYWQGLLYFVLVLALPLSLAVAILRYRLWDIDIIINRALVYGTLTVALAAAYLGSVAMTQAVLRVLTGQESQLAVVASTLAIAALFQPLRRRIQQGIDRRFYRRKYDARQALAAFGALARDEVDLEALSEAMVSLVNETIQPASISLWLDPVDGRSEERRAQG